MHKILAILFLFVASLEATAFCQSDELDRTSFFNLQSKLRLLLRPAIPRNNATVADEFKLTKDQRLKLAVVQEEFLIFSQEQIASQEFTERQKAQTEFARSCEEKLKQILSENQLRRLDELELQQAGALALSRADVIRKLGLSAAQRWRFRDAQAERIGMRGADGPKRFGQTCYAILNEAQRAKWKEMIGEPSSSVILLAPLVAVTATEHLLAVNDDPALARQRNESVPFSRLRNPVVQAELQLTEEQLAKLAESDAKVHEASRESRAARSDRVTLQQRLPLMHKATQARHEFRDLLNEELNEAQSKRLGEIQFQALAEHSILSREFRVGAKLTDDQINELDQWIQDRGTLFGATAKPSANPTSEGLRTAALFKRETVKKALELLTNEQRDIWNQMAGKPVAIEGLFDAPSTPGE